MARKKPTTTPAKGPKLTPDTLDKPQAPKKTEKVKHSFGIGAEVIVINPESVLHNMVGVVMTAITKSGEYNIAFPEPTGSHLVGANDLDLPEEKRQATIPASTKAEFRILSLLDITEDPNQPRKHFDEAALKELTASIQEKGVLQPIVVRPQSKGFMVVCGERRFRATRAAGLTDIPAIIRELSDNETLELQIMENLQRADVHPMEEGIAFKRLLDNGSDIEALRLKIGVSAKYVATRIKLADLIPPLQQAFLNGAMELKHAVLLSKADAKTQKSIYQNGGGAKMLQPGGKLNAWNLESAVKQHENDLNKAPFKTEDPTLNPEMGPCAPCPFNTSNTPRLFMGEERICTNGACYAIKTKNEYKRKLEKAAANPDMLFLDSSYYHGDQEKMRLQAAKELGVQVVGRTDIIEAPADPGPKPEWESYLAEQKKNFDEQFEEGDSPFDEADAKEEFESDLEDWEDNNKDYQRSLEPGATKKAFVVTGNNAGKTVSIIVKTEKAETIESGDTTGESVKELEKREARAKELDNEKVYKIISPLIAKHEPYLTSTEALSREETCALAVYMWENSSAARSWLAKELKADGSYYNLSADFYKTMLTELQPGTMNRFIRIAITDRLITASELDYGRLAKAAAIMGIGRQYLPTEVKDAEQLQQEKANKRGKRVAECIAELKAPPTPAPAVEDQTEPQLLRTENGRNIIKYRNPDNGSWKKLEGPFADQAAMEQRYRDLIATGKYASEKEAANA